MYVARAPFAVSRPALRRASSAPSPSTPPSSSSSSRLHAATNGDGANKPSWERDNAKDRRIWEIDIDAEFERVERAKADAERAAQAKASSGLGFGRAKMLDDMSLDLSATLKRKGGDEAGDEDARRSNPKALPSGQAAALLSASAKSDELKFVDERGKMIGEPSALDLATTKKGESKYNLNGWNYAPTRAEKGRWQREWEKAERAKAMKTPGYRPASSTAIKSKIKDATFMPQKAFADMTDEEKARRRAEDEAKYKKIKEDLLLTTAGMAGSGAVAAFAVGGYNMGFSWLLGAAGAIVYVRLLSGKAESEGGGQGGPPSILVPVILFMALNRYNTFFAEDLGVTLTPIPMLLAFFTYKPASILQAFKDVLGAEEDDESQTA
jgi:ATP synthase protein I